MKTWKFKFGVMLAILSWLAASAAWAVERGQLPMADNLAKAAKEARSKQVPVLILFSSAGCHYCAQVREEFLIPMTRNAEYDSKVVMLEVEAGSSARLVDFDGKPTTHGEFASRYGIYMTPTVKLLDAQGKEAAIPIVGVITRDYYGGFLDEAINAALKKIRGAAATANAD